VAQHFEQVSAAQPEVTLAPHAAEAAPAFDMAAQLRSMWD
jgi:hypothetical protein